MDRLRIGYARVSTASGDQLAALPHQRSALEREGCDLILSDIESGLSTARENYQQLRSLIQAGTVAQVVATEFSRLGRDAAESDAFIALCDQHRTVVRTLQDGRLTLTTPEDLLLTRLKGSLAQGESMRISQRILRGLNEGRKLGKPMRKPCWGYRLNADRTAFEPHPDQYPIAERFIATLKANSWRMLPSLKALPAVPFRSVRGVRSWLLNPTLRGGVGYHQLPNHQFREILWDRHQPVLSHADFASFLAITESNRKRWGANATTIPRALTSLCRCAECGNTLKYIGGRTIPSLRCSGETCSQLYKGTREAVIIAFALQQLATGAASQLAAAARNDEPPEAVELRQQITKLEALDDPDLLPVIEAKRHRLVAVLKQPSVDQQLLEKIADPRWADLATYDEVRTMLQQLVASIEITRQVPTAIALRL
jgi:DNA invertase Pin-like site-specific DNA recombinase